jgi:hypothetical protein
VYSRDYLKECNNQGLPLEDFRLTFCVRCQQPECTRSTFGTSAFHQRVSTWYDRLFENVPRMDSGDPRFGEISAQPFQGVAPSDSSDWVDPRDLSATKTYVEVPVGFCPPVPPEPLIQEVTEEEPKVPRVEPLSNMTREIALLNTPSKGEVYLQGNKGNSQPEVRRDPWAAPEASKPGEVVVARGATVRLGGVR